MTKTKKTNLAETLVELANARMLADPTVLTLWDATNLTLADLRRPVGQIRKPGSFSTPTRENCRK